MTKVYSYLRISDAGQKLAELYRSYGQSLIFLVPTTLDKDSLTDVIMDKAPIFGERPQIFTIAELYNRLAEEDIQTRRLIDPPDHKLILKYLVEQYKEQKDTAKLPAGLFHKGFITLLSDNIHTLIREGVSASLLYEKAIAELDEYEPETILYDLYKAYLNYLDDNGLTDSVQTPDRLIELLSCDGKAAEFMQRHHFAPIGFSSFTGNQLKMFKLLEELYDITYFMPRTGMKDKFRGGISQLGFIIGKDAQISSEPVKIKQLSANNRNLEFASIARELALWKANKGNLFEGFDTDDNFSLGNVGILASPQTLDAIENQLRRYKLPYFVNLRGTVDETSLGRLPQLIWTAYTSVWETEETAFLLADPLLSPNGFDYRKFLEKFVRGEKNWHEKLAEYAPDTAPIFEELVTLCKDLQKKHKPHEILTIWRTFVAKLNAANNVALYADELPEYDFVVKNLAHAIRELDKKINILTDVEKNIGPASCVEYEGAESVDFLLDWATTATLPIQLPQKGAIALYGKAPATFVQHDYWIMTDVDGNNWPGKLRESPLLRREQLELINETDEENKLRSAHIPTLGEQREQKEILFRRMLATAKKGVLLARAKADENGRPQPDATFIAELFDPAKNNFREADWQKVEPGIEYNLSNSVPNAGDEWFEGAELSDECPKLDRGKFPRAAVYKPEKLSISLSKLDTWITCPYRYWCQSIRLERWQSDFFNRMRAGNLNHKLWELYWQQPKDQRGSIYQFVQDNWNDEAIQSEYKQLSSEQLQRHNELLKEQAETVALLLDEIERHAKESGRIDVWVEKDLKDEDGKYFEISGVEIRGKADRIDIYKGNKAVILDYKLNSSKTHAGELQLAAYGYLLKQLYGLDTVGYCWIGHKDGKIYGCFTDEMKEIYGIDNSSICLNEQKLLENLNSAKEHLNTLAQTTLKGKFTANYKIEESKHICTRYCEFGTLCRRLEYSNYMDTDESYTEENEDENA